MYGDLGNPLLCGVDAGANCLHRRDRLCILAMSSVAEAVARFRFLCRLCTTRFEV